MPRARPLTFDIILAILENPLRREILAKLSRETHYPLQLSRELSVSQQAVMKHLRLMERYRMVRSIETASTSGGPPRKCYTTTRGFSVRIDVGPHTFHTEFVPLAAADGAQERAGHIERRLREAASRKEPARRFRELARILAGLNQEIAELERRRTTLIEMKEAMQEKAFGTVGEMSGSYEERMVLYGIAEHGGRFERRIRLSRFTGTSGEEE